MRTKSLSETPSYPRSSALFQALVLAFVAASLGAATARARFQSIDWDVESRDLQSALRRAEREASALNRDAARLRNPDRLVAAAGEGMGLAKLSPEAVSRLPLSSERVAAWDAALFAEKPEARHELADAFEPVTAMISEASAGGADGLSRDGEAAPRSLQTTATGRQKL